MPKQVHRIVTQRRVGLAELTIQEVTVLPEYFVEAESPDEALEDFYWAVPIEHHDHFDVRVND